jgi:hypothetical protein
VIQGINDRIHEIRGTTLEIPETRASILVSTDVHQHTQTRAYKINIHHQTVVN